MGAQAVIPLLNRAIGELEHHLTEPIAVDVVAARVGYSRFHFSRTFLAWIGLTPTAYLRKRRLSEAARALITTTARILEIALDYQFQSQEAFTRSFKREFGVSPGLYRWRGRLRRLFGPITLRPAPRLLYPGRGLERRWPLLVPERQWMAALLVPHPRLDRAGLLQAAKITIQEFQICNAPQRSQHPQMLRLFVARRFASEDANSTIANLKLLITIRPAHRHDLPALCHLYHTLHEFTARGVPDRLHSLGTFEQFDATGLVGALEKLIDALDVAILVAEVSGQVIGLAEVYLRADEAHPSVVARRYGYLQSLVVAPRWRGRGLGQQLLSAAEAWAKAHGAGE
jgi:AraC-like DNA-binding protein/GNAT superfamily N-acetyltransferase